MTRSQSKSICELRGFVDLNFARRLEMAETATRDQVSGLERHWPDATSEMIAGRYGDLWRSSLSGELHR